MLEEQSLKYLNAWGVWEKNQSWKHRATLTKVCDVNENNLEQSAALSPLTGAPKQLDTPTAAATTNICPAAASCRGNTGFHIPTHRFPFPDFPPQCPFHLMNLILPRLWSTTPSRWGPDPRPQQKKKHTPINNYSRIVMGLCGYVTVFW